MNKVILIGKLTKDIELRYSQSNVAIAQFNLAVKRDFKNSNEEYETDFINCVAYKNSAELLDKYCSKGSLIAIEGRIQTRNYDGKDGKKIYVTEVITSNIQFLDTKKEGQAPKKSQAEVLSKAMNDENDPFANVFDDFGNSINADEIELTNDMLPF